MRAAIGHHGAARQFKIAAQQRGYLGGRQALGHGGEVANIGKQHCGDDRTSWRIRCND